MWIYIRIKLIDIKENAGENYFSGIFIKMSKVHYLILHLYHCLILKNIRSKPHGATSENKKRTFEPILVQKMGYTLVSTTLLQRLIFYTLFISKTNNKQTQASTMVFVELAFR